MLFASETLFRFLAIKSHPTLVAKKNKEHEEIRTKMEETSSLIDATDAAIAKSTTENHVLETELKATLRDHERQTKTKIELEGKILEVLQDHISSDQASRASARSVRELQNKRRELELNMSSTEEQWSKMMYELEKLKGIVAANRARIDELAVKKIMEFSYSHQHLYALLLLHKMYRERKVMWRARPMNTTVN